MASMLCSALNPDCSSLTPTRLSLPRLLRAPNLFLRWARSLTLGWLRGHPVHLPVLTSLWRTRGALRFWTCDIPPLARLISLYPVIFLTAVSLSTQQARSMRPAWTSNVYSASLRLQASHRLFPLHRTQTRSLMPSHALRLTPVRHGRARQGSRLNLKPELTRRQRQGQSRLSGNPWPRSHHHYSSGQGSSGKSLPLGSTARSCRLRLGMTRRPYLRCNLNPGIQPLVLLLLRAPLLCRA